SLTRLQVVDTMHERKRLMAEHCNAFIALPGGIGTFEELFEVWTWRHLGYHSHPIGLLDAGGYYSGLLEFLAHSVREGLLSESQMAMLHTGSDVELMLDTLSALRAASTQTPPLDLI